MKKKTAIDLWNEAPLGNIIPLADLYIEENIKARREAVMEEMAEATAEKYRKQLEGEI